MNNYVVNTDATDDSNYSYVDKILTVLNTFCN